MTSETEETVLDLEALKARLRVRWERIEGASARKINTILAERRDALAAIERLEAAALSRAPGAEEPSEMGQFVGDIFFGDPTNSTRGTHRWTGTEWVPLPTDVEVLTEMLASAPSARV